MSEYRGKKEDMWEAIKRSDGYLFATNLRTAFLVTYAFAISAATVKLGFWSFASCNNSLLFVFFIPISAVFVLSVGMTLYRALSASEPNTGWSSASIYCLPETGNRSSSENRRVKEQFAAQGEDADFEELALQYFELASILNAKFVEHKKAIWWAKFPMLFSFGGMFLVELFK